MPAFPEFFTWAELFLAPRMRPTRFAIRSLAKRDRSSSATFRILSLRTFVIWVLTQSLSSAATARWASPGDSTRRALLLLGSPRQSTTISAVPTSASASIRPLIPAAMLWINSTPLPRATGASSLSKSWGGAPTTFDRVLGSRFGSAAARLVRKGEFGRMLALLPPYLQSVPIRDAIRHTKTVPLDHDMLESAREIGICFGD